MGKKAVLVLGAGATVADCEHLARSKHPPLDRGFFDSVLREYETQLRPVVSYLRRHYGVTDLQAIEINSLERVMAVLYTDVFGGSLEREAFDAFRALVKVFIRRLSMTTNSLKMSRKSKLYRMVAGQLNSGVAPEDLTVVTFNQDLQVEKALHTIAGTKRRRATTTFCFPGCYRFDFDRVTAPTSGSAPLFDLDNRREGVSVLKLHGSLNWYSNHNTPNPSRKALFDPRRNVGCTRRRAIEPTMGLTSSSAGRARFTWPIIIPPVVHKSGILHERLNPVWTLAERRLREADRVIIFGYSCPENDWESANLIGRSLTANTQREETTLIDINPLVVGRYASLARLASVHFYSSAKAYLDTVHDTS